MYDRTRAPVPRRVTQESGGWQKRRSSYEYASRYIYIYIYTTIAEPSWKGNNSTSLSLSLFPFLSFFSLSLSLSVPAGFSFCSRPRRPRHAQQTSPTVRSGRHAAFVMFPRSSFDGSVSSLEEASAAGGKQGQWRPLVGALSNRARGKPRPIYDWLRSFRFDFQLRSSSSSFQSLFHPRGPKVSAPPPVSPDNGRIQFPSRSAKIMTVN